MADDIRITAQIDPHRPEACKFSTDKPVHEGGWAYFDSAEKAKDSPLAERLFAVETVKTIRISGSTITVTKEGFGDWKTTARDIGKAIREHLESSLPAVAEGKDVKMISDDEVKKTVQELLESQINPSVASHGGFVELLDVKDNRVFLKLGGGCQGCGMANVTLRQGIEGVLRDKLPQIDEILDSTDHAAGTNPYYAPSGK